MKMTLPKSGLPRSELRAKWEGYRANDIDWRRGRAPLYVFYAGEDVLDVAKEAYTAFMSENGLAPRAFPSLKRMEDEVIEMTLSLLNAKEGSEGNMTSGGSESIFLAAKSARDWAREERPVSRPTIVVPDTAHPAFYKAAHYLGLQVKRIPVGADFRADTDAMAAAVDADTIMLVGSAPAFPHGVIDPIEPLSDLALRRNLWLHVDACVGGFAAPFVRRLGYPIPQFDFSVLGVCSISADLHKYGFTAKGASTILFRDGDLQKYQPFVSTGWAKGKYQTPNLCGTRPGGAIAAAWAVMTYLGEEGYLGIQDRIMKLRDRYIRGIEAIEGFGVYGAPHLGIVSFGSATVDAHAVADILAERGWYPSLLAEPKGIHLMLNLAHEPVVDEYLSDLRAAAERARHADEPNETGAREIMY